MKGCTPFISLAESRNKCLISYSNKWVIDSGVTDHMTGNSKIFSGFQSHKALPPVTIADGSTYNIEGSRTVKPTLTNYHVLCSKFTKFCL